MKINIVRPFLPNLDEIKKEFSECLETGMVTNNSQYVRKFEDNLQQYLQSKIKPVTYCNGEMALFALIQACKTKLGYDSHSSFEVIVPSFTFSGTINALIANNLKPVFCDVDETLTIDVEKINRISKNTKIIVAVGVYGNLPDIEKLGKLSAQNNLMLIFDNAPAFGATYKGHFPNYYGYPEIYSFHATKIYTSMEGGAAIVNDKELYELLLKLRDFGQYEKSRGDVDVPGLNAKMQEISAIVGIKNLEKIKYILTTRRKRIIQYKEFFDNLQNEGKLKNMVVRKEVSCPYLYYPIILNNEASDFVEYMNKNNIAVRRYYTAVHTLKLYKNKYEALNLDFTESIKDNIVSLPIHTDMTDNEVDYLFNTIKKYFNL